MRLIRSTRTNNMNIHNDRIKEQAHWVMEACEMLGKISQSAEYLDRRYLSAEHKAANELVAKWMQERNMQTWVDGVGNVWGSLKSPVPNAKTLLFGSHLDTVVNGGKYDGMLGVVSPIAVVKMLNDAKLELPFNIDIVGFCDEEGTRFGSTLLGSRALTGTWQAQWAELQDADGISLRQAMTNFGLDFDQVDQCKVCADDLIAYIETHIEQGPVLEAHDLPLGIVTAIAGAKRLLVKVTGMAGHAGTVPMRSRQDALAGVSEMILAVEQHAKQANIVATVGKIVNQPNAVNVISGFTTFNLDIRSDNDSVRDACLEHILADFDRIASKRSLSISVEMNHQAPAIHCSPQVIEHLQKATNNCGIDPFRLLSGAGHDAMAMADICPVGMLFVRCKKGISHHPAEQIKTEDVAATLAVMSTFVCTLTI